MFGGEGNDRLNGGDNNDAMYGEAGNDILIGGNHNDILIGGTGNDILIGGNGTDVLTGGSDADLFGLSSAGGNKITDFVVADDTLFVSAADLGGGISPENVVAVAQFVIGTTATNANERFIYDNTNGSLYFDADGIGATQQIQIASLASGLTLTNNDIFVVA
jgi:Ca2+-binding RTX toxin-like protein